MATIFIKDEDQIEISIKHFRKEVERENIIREVKERQYFIKPSKKKKMAAIKLRKRLKRKDKKRKYNAHL